MISSSMEFCFPSMPVSPGWESIRIASPREKGGGKGGEEVGLR